MSKRPNDEADLCDQPSKRTKKWRASGDGECGLFALLPSEILVGEVQCRFLDGLSRFLLSLTCAHLYDRYEIECPYERDNYAGISFAQSCVEEGPPSLISWVLDFLAEFDHAADDGDLLKSAVARGDIQLLQHVENIRPRLLDVDRYEWALDSYPEAVEVAARYGNIDMAEYLVDEVGYPSTRFRVLRSAARYGQYEFIKWMITPQNWRETLSAVMAEELMVAAADNGHMETCLGLYEITRVPISETTLAEAASRSKLQFLKLVHEKRAGLVTTMEVFLGALTGGNAETLNYLEALTFGPALLLYQDAFIRPAIQAGVVTTFEWLKTRGIHIRDCNVLMEEVRILGEVLNFMGRKEEGDPHKLCRSFKWLIQNGATCPKEEIAILVKVFNFDKEIPLLLLEGNYPIGYGAVAALAWSGRFEVAGLFLDRIDKSVHIPTSEMDTFYMISDLDIVDITLNPLPAWLWGQTQGIPLSGKAALKLLKHYEAAENFPEIMQFMKELKMPTALARKLLDEEIARIEQPWLRFRVREEDKYVF